MRHPNTGEVRVYNIKNDLAEKYNLAERSPELVASLSKKMDSYLDKVDAPKIEDVYEARLADQLEKRGKKATTQKN